jgi:nucleotide-binding universal stress UspA family protein
MALFNRILFPIDLSETSKKIVPFVREAIDSFGAELHIVYSLNLVPHYFSTNMSASCIDEIEDGVRKEAVKKTRRFIESQFDDLSVQSKLLIGSPGQEIIKCAEEKGIDLIVLGHNSTGIAESVLGSVADYVASHSRIPVLIINPGIHVDKASTFWG